MFETRLDRRTRALFERLVSEARVRTIVGSPDRRVIEGCRLRGEPIPDALLPGRMVMRLGEAERGALRSLRSDHVATYRTGWLDCGA